MGHQQRIDQHPFARHRMGRYAGKHNFCSGSIEVFIHHFAQFAAVDGPGEINIKARFQIQRFRAAQPNLFVRHKGHHDVAVVAVKVLHQRHHHGDRRFVVRAQHAGAVAEDHLLTDVGRDLRMFIAAQPDILLSIQTEIFALPGEDLRVDIGRQTDINGIDMRNKPDARRVSPVAAFHRRHRGMVINHHLIQP